MSMKTALGFLISLLLAVRGEDDTCPTTPKDLKSVFLSKCNELHPFWNCERHVWAAFKHAFAGKDPVEVEAEDYRLYFSLFLMVPDADTSLFWSGTTPLVDMLSCQCPTGANVVSSANTGSSWIINESDKEIEGDLNWCGSDKNPPGSEGIEYTKPCDCGVSYSFWEQFSVMFAQAARGTVFWLGNGEKEWGAYSDTSFFALYELPNLSTTKVHSVVVMVTHRRGKGEACGKGSIVDLRDDILNRGLQFVCYDVFGDPNNSSDFPKLTKCIRKLITKVQRGIYPKWKRNCYKRQSPGVNLPLLE